MCANRKSYKTMEREYPAMLFAALVRPSQTKHYRESDAKFIHSQQSNIVVLRKHSSAYRTSECDFVTSASSAS